MVEFQLNPDGTQVQLENVNKNNPIVKDTPVIKDTPVEREKMFNIWIWILIFMLAFGLGFLTYFFFF